jgi:hypothetical protein
MTSLSLGLTLSWIRPTIIGRSRRPPRRPRLRTSSLGTSSVEALPPGTDGAGQPPTAVKLLAALVKRFGQANNIGIVQQAIAEFHFLSLAPNEKLETFINRLTAAMRRLHGLGKTDVDLDVYCLGRLKESLLHDSRYSQIALTLRANTTMTWDEAVDLLLSYEMTLEL